MTKRPKTETKASPGPTSAVVTRRRWPRMWTWTTLLALLVAAGWWETRPYRILREAYRSQTAQPRQAENLAWSAVDAAGGDYPEAYWLICRMLARQGRWAETLGAFDLIERTDDLDGEELLELARNADRAGQWVLALRCLAAAAHPGPAEVAVRLEQSRIAFSHGDHDLAYRASARLTDLDPANPLPWMLMGRIDHIQGDFPKAIAELRKCLERNPPRTEVGSIREELVELLLGVGDRPAARQELNLAKQAGEPSDALRLHEAYLLRLEGDSQAAFTIVEPLLSRGFAEGRTRQLRGMLHFDRGDWSSAKDDFERVVALHPRNKESHFQLGQCLSRLGEKDKARHHLATAEDLTRQVTEILTLRDQLRENPDDLERKKRLHELESLGRQ